MVNGGKCQITRTIKITDCDCLHKFSFHICIILIESFSCFMLVHRLIYYSVLKNSSDN